jgi:hypothetical protein
MRKLKLQTQVTVDGFMAGPNGELDWMTWDWDEELQKYVSDLTDTVDCILLDEKWQKDLYLTGKKSLQIRVIQTTLSVRK